MYFTCLASQRKRKKYCSVLVWRQVPYGSYHDRQSEVWVLSIRPIHSNHHIRKVRNWPYDPKKIRRNRESSCRHNQINLLYFGYVGQTGQPVDPQPTHQENLRPILVHDPIGIIDQHIIAQHPPRWFLRPNRMSSIVDRLGLRYPQTFIDSLWALCFAW